MFLNLGNFRYMQYFASISASISMSCFAIFTAWTSPTLPLLFQDDSPIGDKINYEEGSWIVSLYFLSPIIASPFIAIMIEKIGRKFTIWISSIFYFLPWILILVANNVWYLYVARFCGGIGAGITLSVCPIYIGEISDADIRGQLSTSLNWMKMLGNFLILLVGPFVSYSSLAIICAVFPLLLFVSLLFMPESPYYLAKIGKHLEAREVLRILASRETPDNVIEKKLEDIERIIKEDGEVEVGWRSLLGDKAVRRLVVITVGLQSLQQLSGYVGIKSYLQTIIDASASFVPPDISSVLFAFVQFPAAVITSVLIDRIGRRPILICASVCCAISLFSEGIYFYLQTRTNLDVTYLNWLPTTGILVYLLMCDVGVVNMPFIIAGELYPSNIKGIAMAAGTCYAKILSFLVSKFFAPISENFGMFTMFWIFGGFCLLGAIFVWIMLPETKGKTFDQIQESICPRQKKIKEIREHF